MENPHDFDRVVVLDVEDQMIRKLFDATNTQVGKFGMICFKWDSAPREICQIPERGFRIFQKSDGRFHTALRDVFGNGLGILCRLESSRIRRRMQHPSAFWVAFEHAMLHVCPFLAGPFFGWSTL